MAKSFVKKSALLENSKAYPSCVTTITFLVRSYKLLYFLKSIFFFYKAYFCRTLEGLAYTRLFNFRPYVRPSPIRSVYSYSANLQDRISLSFKKINKDEMNESVRSVENIVLYILHYTLYTLYCTIHTTLYILYIIFHKCLPSWN